MVERSGLAVKSIVLVHGGFVDGSGWEGVYNILRKDGYTVAVDPAARRRLSLS